MNKIYDTFTVIGEECCYCVYIYFLPGNMPELSPWKFNVVFCVASYVIGKISVFIPFQSFHFVM